MKIKNIQHLYVLNYDGEVVRCAVLCQQVLTVASEGEELVIKGLEVRLADNQALTYRDNNDIMSETN